MAYFDNAATTYPKPEVVYTSMDKFYRLNGANAGRGRYNLAQSANALIGETRALVQELLHCPAKQVVFTPTATIALIIWRNTLWNSDKGTMIVNNQKLTERILLYYWDRSTLTAKEISTMKIEIKSNLQLADMEDVETLLADAIGK